MDIQNNVSLSDYTSFGVGGPAEKFVLVDNSSQLEKVLHTTNIDEQIWLLGYGSNTLISDRGLPGLTVCVRGGDIIFNGQTVTVDAGVDWDRLVEQSVERGLWGSELMSKIPGSVGAALFINITAYGQSIGSLVKWIDVFNRETNQVERLHGEHLVWDYKHSHFQTDAGKHLIILRACLQFSSEKTEELTYQKALDVAEELNLDIHNIKHRREIIIEARARAGSLLDESHTNKTVGSFFRNPIVSAEQVEAIIANDESGKTAEQIRNMNRVHGGDEQRVSAAHVMLAAGFHRGQEFADGRVKLNDQNLLKIEALPGASAQDIYETMLAIQNKVTDSLGISLEPEVRLLGEF